MQTRLEASAADRGRHLANGSRSCIALRHALLRHEAPRAPRSDARWQARHLAAGRADEPSRPRFDSLDRGFPAARVADARLRDSRPSLPAAASPRESSRSSGRGSSTGPATMRRSWRARKRCWPRRPSRKHCSTRSWPRRRSGSGRASRPAARATKGASTLWSGCGRNVEHVASESEMSACKPRRWSAQETW